ncbi:hypothetical protein D3C86_1808460 [compost metagenome]
MYNPARIQTTPSLPKLPIKSPTMAGPTNTASPAPKFRTAIAAPLSLLTNEGIRADNGTYPARRAPHSTPQNMTIQKFPSKITGE